MNLCSMTGYGRGVARGAGLRVVCELASVNRKQLDVRIALPRALAVLEGRVAACVREHVSRGQVTGTLELGQTEQAKAASVSVDLGLAAGYARALRTAARSLRVPPDFTLRDLLLMPDVLRREGPGAQAELAWPVIERALRLALKALVAMRAREGRRLGRDLRTRLAALAGLRERIAELAASVPARYRDQLARRLRDLARETPVDPAILARELAVAAERCDVTEELTRLASHFEEAGRLFAAREPAGRALDFLLQEMFREINTIGSKAGDAAISRLVVESKAELERVREQVQNVE